MKNYRQKVLIQTSKCSLQKQGEIEEQENWDIKSISHALKCARGLQKFLINVSDDEELLLTSKLNIRLEKHAYILKNMKQICLADYFK